MYRYILLFLFLPAVLFSGQKVDKLVIAGPFASVSHPILKMIEDDALKDIANKVEFRLWKNPDELRAMVIQGDVDFVALPTNTAAILYNKGVDLTLINVSTWGILGMVSRDNSLKHLSDFKGKEVIVPFRADMPDILFSALLKKEGIDPKKDMKLRYVSTPIDAMQMLILRRADHVLLAEPAISVALRKTKSFPISVVAPELYRSVDLQQEYAKIFHTSADVPQAGLAVLGKHKHNHALIQRLLKAYESALTWYISHPQKAGELVANHIDMLTKEGVADSIGHINMKSVSALESKEKLTFFFNILKEGNAKSIGGKLPDDNFYYHNRP